MTLAEAFADIEHLPTRERLLIGGLENGQTVWCSGHIDDLDRLDALGYSPGVAGGISEAIEDFRIGDADMAVVVVNTTDNVQIILALGPDSPSAVAQAFQELIRHHAH